MTGVATNHTASTAPGGVQAYFDELATWANGLLQGEEILTAYLSAEDSNFVRFNRNLVRQAGSVAQRELTVDLIDGAKHAAGSIQLSQDRKMDEAVVVDLITRLREQRQLTPDDPYLAVSTDAASSGEQLGRSQDPSARTAEVIDEIQAVSDGKDLVGIYADGSMYRGFASSLGQRNWFESDTFNFDWSFYLHGDKAVKNGYAGRSWDSDAFATKVESASHQLDSLARTPIDLAPGAYRTYLTPTAMESLMIMLSYGGFGLKAHRTMQTPLLRMTAEDQRLHHSVRLSEDTAGGTAPHFQEQGFVRPAEVVLIDRGRLDQQLVSPRSGREYEVATNGASLWERPESLSVAPGDLPTAEVLQQLGTGLLIGNLWYLNFSDRSACRTTGMTRFATFWVEGGEVAAPANVMRFDDTVYNILGSNLVGLSDDAETILNPSTYGGRSSASFRLPGALVEGMTFTL
jgi:predicted Zn-dependent protease